MNVIEFLKSTNLVIDLFCCVVKNTGNLNQRLSLYDYNLPGNDDVFKEGWIIAHQNWMNSLVKTVHIDPDGWVQQIEVY